MRSPGGELKAQRGAIGIMAALTLFMVILFAVLAVDSSRLWLEKRRLQNVADMAAIEASQVLNGCDQTLSLGSARAAAERSAMANEPSLQNLISDVQLGTYTANQTTGIRIFNQSNSQVTAVRVAAARSVPASLMAGGFFTNNITLQAEAVAPIRAPIATFSVGSTLVSLDTDNSPLLKPLLRNVLRTGVSLDAVSFKGVADAHVTLLDLIKTGSITGKDGLTVGSVSELLDAPLNLAGFLDILDAVAQQGEMPDANNLALLNKLINAGGVLHTVRGLVNETLDGFTLGKILNIANPNDSAVLGTQLSVLQLFETAMLAQVSAQIANGKNLLDLSVGTPLQLLGLNVLSQLRVIEPPQIAMGPPAKGGVACTVARTAQVQLEVSINTFRDTSTGGLGAIFNLVSNLLDKIAKIDIDLKLIVQVAAAQAALDDIAFKNNSTDVAFTVNSNLVKLRLTRQGCNDIDYDATCALPASIKLTVPLIQKDPLEVVAGLKVGEIEAVDGLDLAFSLDNPVHPINADEGCDETGRKLSACSKVNSSLSAELKKLLSADSLVLKICTSKDGESTGCSAAVNPNSPGLLTVLGDIVGGILNLVGGLLQGLTCILNPQPCINQQNAKSAAEQALNIILQAVVGLLANISQVLIDPLLKLLGIDLMGVTVQLDDVQSANRQSLLR